MAGLWISFRKAHPLAGVALSLEAEVVQTAATLVDVQSAPANLPFPCFSEEGKLEEELGSAPGSPIVWLWVYPLSPRKS